MVQIIQFPTDEKIPDEEFHPNDKYGILVVGKNLYTGFTANVPYSRWSPSVSGNRNIYDWELLMTGRVDFGERSPLNVLDDIVGHRKDEQGIDRIFRTVPKEIIRMQLNRDIVSYESGKNSNGGYKEVAKVWPGTEEVLPEFVTAVERFADLSDSDTLTTMVIFSHGEKGAIQMGSSWLTYKQILENLDTIKGKKALFVYACHSGSFLKTLRLHPQRRNYAVISSCEADNLSLNWNDRELDDFLFNHFSHGRRYSDLQLKPINGADHDQHPQMLRYFDVKLI